MNASAANGSGQRPALPADAERLAALINANTMALSGEAEVTLQDLTDFLSNPDLDRERDTRVVFAPDGRLIAFALVFSKSRPALPTVDVFLHASEWGRDATTIPMLLEWAEARSRENLPAIAPELRVAMRSNTNPHDEQYVAALVGAGYQPIRHSFQMAITFDTPPEAPALPDGFTLRVAERDDDPVPVVDAFLDAWRDHFGYIERPYEQSLESWRHAWERTFAPGLWLLGMDGDTVAGMSLCLPEYGGNEQLGYVQTLAVRRAYRRRGLAEALLRHSFAALANDGKTGARLHVDASSLTGATRLYERAGMTVHTRYTLYEKELRPGIDPSTHGSV